MTIGKCRVEKLEKRQCPRFLPKVQAPPGITRLPACCRLCRSRHKRHRFAIETLLRWYRQGEKPDRLLPVLSTFLGHTHVSGTYWYLSSTPELMRAAGQRLERRWKGVR